MGKKNNTSAYQHKKTPLITDMKRHKWLYLMVLPGVIWMIIFLSAYGRPGNGIPELQAAYSWSFRHLFQFHLQ